MTVILRSAQFVMSSENASPARTETSLTIFLNNMRWKAWPRRLCRLRCSLGSARNDRGWSRRLKKNIPADDRHLAARFQNFRRRNFHDVCRKNGEIGELADLD